MKKIKENKFLEWLNYNIEVTGNHFDFLTTAQLNKDFCATYKYEYDQNKNKGFGQLFNKIIKNLNLKVQRATKNGYRGWTGLRFRAHMPLEEKIKILKNIEYEISDKFFGDVQNLLNDQAQMIKFLYENFNKGKRL